MPKASISILGYTSWGPRVIAHFWSEADTWNGCQWFGGDSIKDALHRATVYCTMAGYQVQPS